jgi:hypothetical protein
MYDFAFYCIFCGHYSDDGDTLNKICFECEDTEAAQEFYKKTKKAFYQDTDTEAAYKKVQNKLEINFEEIRNNIINNMSKEELKELALRALCYETAVNALNKKYGKKAPKK